MSRRKSLALGVIGAWLFAMPAIGKQVSENNAIVFAEDYVAMHDLARQAAAQGEAHTLLDIAERLLSWDLRPGAIGWTGDIAGATAIDMDILSVEWLWHEAERVGAQDPKVSKRIAAQMFSDVRGTNNGLTRSTQKIAASGRASTRLKFRADEIALVMVEASSVGKLSLTVRDSRGHTRCSDLSQRGIALCQWIPKKGQQFTLVVTNESNVAVDFALVHN